MNSKKLMVILFVLFSLPVFAQRPDMSLIPYRVGNLWGYATADKQIVIKPAYDEANWFYAGYAAVKKGSKYGYINKSGKLVIPYKFYSAKPFRYGFMDNGKPAGDTVLFAGASLQSANGFEICINTKGQRMTQCPAIPENSDSNNRKPVTTTVIQKNYGVVMANGNVYDKIDDDYKIAGSEDNYYIGEKNSQYGVFNNKFEVIVPFEYSSIKKMDINGVTYLQVIKNGKNGIINGNGTSFISTDNSNIVYAKTPDGRYYFITTKDGKAMVRDLHNQDVIPANYSDIAYDDKDGFVLTGNNAAKGYYYADSHKTISPKYAELKSTRNSDYLWVKTMDGKTGYINRDGQEYFQ